MGTIIGEAKLTGVHPDLVRVVRRAATIAPGSFSILEGLRTVARQRQLVASGASKTMDSRHIQGMAVDLGVVVGGKVRWDWPLYSKQALVIRQAASLEHVQIRWGGTWNRITDPLTPLAHFADGPHFELPAALYPNVR